MIPITQVENFISEHKRNKELWVKVNTLITYIVAGAVDELKDIRYKVTNSAELSDDAIKEILREQGFKYITDVMDTINGFNFDVMISFMDLINQLKGTRKGMSLVLNLMGFDSIIKEWWEDAENLQEPWSYEIIILVDNSIVPDIFTTIDKVKIFSEHYVLAKIANIDVRFLSERFAEVFPVMGGITKARFRGRIIQRI